MAAAAAPQKAIASATKTPEDPKDQDKKRLYVRWEVTDDTLKSAFEKFGKIAETRVVRGPRLRAFGFLTFETEEAATKAKAAMENQSIPAGPLEIQFASAAGAARAREKKERKPREAKAPADGKSGSESKRGGRAAARGGKAAGGAAPAAKSEGKTEGKRGGRKSRRGRGRGAAAAGTDAPARNEGKRDSKKDDPNWGKVVRLVPDPIKTPINPAQAEMLELNAGVRAYKAGRTDAKQIASLVLNADPTKGPFNCEFKLGAFALKLLEVKVSSRDGSVGVAGAPGDGIRDTRVGCRVVHPDSNRSREVYLRVKGQEHKHKFLELRLPNPKDANGKEQDQSAEVESFFVTIDSIALDVKTGLWKKIMLSLMSMMVPRVSQPREKTAAAGGAAASADTKSAK